MKKLPGQAEAVSKAVTALAAPLHANCYLSPAGLTKLFPDRTRKRRVGRIALATSAVVVVLAAIVVINLLELPEARKLIKLLNWMSLW
jgi:hypothetical protein